MRRSPFRTVLVTLTTVSVWAAVLLPAGTSRAASITWSVEGSWDLGSGVTLQRWLGTGPIRAFVLKFDPATSPASVDVAMPSTQYPADEITSVMGAANGAIAAINGDFGDNRPKHATAADGTLWQSGLQHGTSFAVSQNGETPFLGPGKPRVNVNAPSGAFTLSRWNSGDPSGHEIVGYTPQGGSLENPDAGACSVRLRPVSGSLTSGLFWTAGRKAIGQMFAVDDKVCKRDKTISEKPGMIVLSTKRGRTNANKHFISDLAIGQTGISVKWSMLGMPGVLDTIGGDPQIVDGGVNTAPIPPCNSKYLCSKNPRVGVGIDGDGTVYYVVVDGRQSGWSIGIYLSDFANFFLNQLHATEAMNLDGGGSTTMWASNASGPYCHKLVASGCLVNHVLSTSGNTNERQVENALLVLPGSDPSEPPISGP